MKAKPKKEVFIERLKEVGEVRYNKFMSETWISGGYRWSFSGEKQAVTPEDTRKFVEFDKLIKEYYPQIRYIDAIDILEKCAEIESEWQNDYYTQLYVSRWVCDIDKLYDMLPETWVMEFRTVCTSCGTTFDYSSNSVFNVDGGLMGDWDAVNCPHCGHTNEHYSKVDYPGHKGGYLRLNTEDYVE